MAAENGSLGIGTFNIQSLLPEKDERLFRAQTRTIKRDLCERIDSLKNDLQNPNFKDRSSTERRLEATQRAYDSVQDKATRRQTVNRIMRREPELYNHQLTRIQEVAKMIDEQNLDILVLCESMLSGKHNEEDLQIDGFSQPIRFDRNGAEKASGGLLVYSRKGIVTREVSRAMCGNNVQYLHIEIGNPVEFHLVAIYSPNKHCFDQVQHTMKHFINKQKRSGELGMLKEKKVIFIGDLNVDPARGDSKARQYFKEAEVEQLVTDLTHNERCIDHILAYNFKQDDFSGKRAVNTGIESITHKLSMCKLKLPQEKMASRKGLAIHKGHAKKTESKCAESPSRRESDEIESSESSILCSTCGQYFKGKHGLAIHKGHAKRNGSRCADSPSKGKRDEYVQVSPHSSSRANSGYNTFHRVTAETARNAELPKRTTKSSESPVLCSTCGQYFKGERGLAIHKGHAKRNGTKCSDSPSRGERDDQGQLNSYLFGGAIEQVQMDPYLFSRANFDFDTFDGFTAQTAYKTELRKTANESSESLVLCETCGQCFKGERGLAIHKGHARRNGTKCSDSPSRRERDDQGQLNPYLFGGAFGQVQMDPYLLSETNFGYDTFDGFTAQTAYNTERRKAASASSDNSVLCSTCGQSFKGERGLAIHKGHARRKGSMCAY